jgi:hypothetical protein
MKKCVLSPILLSLILVMAALFNPMPAKGADLQIVGDVKAPNFVRTDEPVMFKIKVSGGPVDNDEVTVIFDFASTGYKSSKGSARGNITREAKGKIRNGEVAVQLKFRDPGNRNNSTCKIKYMSAGKEKETKPVVISNFQVD